MGNIFDLIRYGFSGYLVLTAILVGLYRTDLIPTDMDFYKDWAIIISTYLFFSGPLLGFLIHQIYFKLWFNRFESYTTTKRLALKTLRKSFENKFPREQYDYDADKLENKCYLCWTFFFSGVTNSKFQLTEPFFKTLNPLRNYSHAFGAITVSCFVSFVVYLLIIARDFRLFDGIDLFSILVMFFLFLSQRISLMNRINNFENGLIEFRKKELLDVLESMIKPEEKASSQQR